MSAVQRAQFISITLDQFFFSYFDCFSPRTSRLPWERGVLDHLNGVALVTQAQSFAMSPAPACRIHEDRQRRSRTAMA